jgi:diguanylate cyclase (GGDEF)-like protein
LLAKNYKLLRKVDSSYSFELFLAQALPDNENIIIKTTKNSYTNEKELKKLQNEFDKLKLCNYKDILSAKKLEKIGNNYALIFEYFEGETLKKIIQNKKFDLNSFVELAIKISESFLYLHKQNIIHSNLSSSCILINKNNEIKILNLCYAKFKKEIDSNHYQFNHTDVYKAPEQTNRISEKISELTDIYSLGIIFYEILTGFPPYNLEDLTSLSHSIVTKEFLSIYEIDSSIPKIISNIIDKMLVKNLSERYSSILSLLVDLKKIKNLMEKNKVLNEFKIDHFKKDFSISNNNTLFGRKRDLDSFIKNISNTQNTNNLFIITGYSGVGKTSFVKKALEHASKNPNQILQVKLDNYKQNTPYKILYNKLRELSEQILTKDEINHQIWKEKIISALGDEVKVLYGIIPELKIILGEKDELVELNPNDGKIRFDNYLFKYLQLFATKEEPLFIFLDDMQWSDNITLNWLEKAIYRLSNVFIIISYRDNEVKDDSSLSILIKELEKNEIKTFVYNLKPLKILDIKNLIDNNINIRNSEDIAKIVFNKTSGNAFFVKQFLKQLLSNNVLYFDYEKFTWICDFNKLSSISATQNILQLLENRINLLEPKNSKFLKIASCIGNKFEENLIKDIYNNDFEFKNLLNQAILDEWITKDINQVYHFSHDRIQQAVYSSIKEKDLKIYHKQIADSIVKLNIHIENNDFLTYINHYNKAKELFITNEEKDFLANLNYEAALTARKNGDFIMSQKYMQEAFSLFLDLSKKENYCEILKNYAICEHLILNKKDALVYYTKAIENSSSNLEKAYIYELIIKLYSEFSDFNEAYNIGREALTLFDVKIPKKFNGFIFAKEFLYLKFKLKNKNPEELINLSCTNDEQIIISIKLLSAILKTAYQIDPKLCVLTSMKLIKICLEHGDTKDAVIGFMVYGVIFQGAILGNHKLGYKYSQLAMKMIEKYKNNILYPEVSFVCGYFGLSWTVPTTTTEQKWFEAYTNGLIIGDLFHSGCAAAGIIQSMFLRGVDFQSILSQIEIFEKNLERINAKEQLGAILSVKQAIKNLQGKTISQNSFNDDNFSENSYEKSLDTYSSKHFAHYYYINKMIVLYIHKKYNDAYNFYLKSKKYLNDSKGTIHGSEHFFYESLILAKRYDDVNYGLKKRYLTILNRNLKLFEKYSLESPENFLVRKNILKAELAKIKKNHTEAFAYLESAIETAEMYSQINLKAIANRILVESYKELNQSKVSELLKKEEFKSLLEWGMNIDEYNQDKNVNYSEQLLDLNTLIKSTEAIIKEQKLANLLKNLLSTILENAGAQYAIVLLKDENSYFVEATASYKSNNIEVMQNIELEKFKNIAHNIVNYVIRTKKPIIINDLNNHTTFFQEEDTLRRGVKSILCLPLILHNDIKGIIYLENNAISGIFTKDKIDLLKHLSGQIAISIENAIIYNNLEKKVQQRTKELDKKNEELEKQNIQLQLQNNKILELNSNIVKENEKRKEVEEKLHEAIKQLDLLATTDALTNIKNRRVFDIVLEQECSKINRTNDSLSLIMCDIDYFKLYNDYYGHLQGDECLKQIAQCIQANLKRSSDIVARYGGEEFGIIMPNTSRQAALDIARNIQEAISKLDIAHEKSQINEKVTLSMGLATTDDIEEISTKNLIRFADYKLYEAKEKGRNQIL